MTRYLNRLENGTEAQTGTSYDNVIRFFIMCFMEIEYCPECKKKHTYSPSFCENYHKGILCVRDDIPATRDTRHNQSTLRATVRFDDRFGNRVMYLSDIMETSVYDFTCDSCIEQTKAEASRQQGRHEIDS
jgi:hypothetical protein